MNTSTSTTERRRRGGSAHFTIEGPALTNIARKYMESGTPDAAWRSLTMTLRSPKQGAAEALAVKLLDGRAKLSGDSRVGMDAEEDDDAEYRERIRFIYAGRIRLGDRWYAPSTKVVHAGEEAHAYAVRAQRCNEYSMSKLDAGQFRRDTFRFYAGEGDRVEFVPGYGVIIFEPTGERPMWWSPLTTTAEAVRDFLSAGQRLDCIDARPVLENPAPPRQYTQEELEASLEAERTEPGRVGRVEAALAAMQAKAALRGKDVPTLRAEILRQAKGDMMELRSEGGELIATVPRVPFVRWSVRRTSLWHLAPAWTNVAPENMKMEGDSRDHSDWLLGAGRDPSDPYYRTPIAAAADLAMGDVQRELSSFRCTVVSSGETVFGQVADGDVLVLPDLSPKHTERFLKARAVIAERGGELSHLAVVGREASIPVVIVSNAASKFPAGTKVEIDTQHGFARAVSEY